jgi:hypothetical protein
MMDLKTAQRGWRHFEIWPYQSETLPCGSPRRYTAALGPLDGQESSTAAGKEIEDELALLGRSQPDRVGSCDRI